MLIINETDMTCKLLKNVTIDILSVNEFRKI